MTIFSDLSLARVQSGTTNKATGSGTVCGSGSSGVMVAKDARTRFQRLFFLRLAETGHASTQRADENRRPVATW